MKVVGIVVEYNPLQNGHEYQIRYAKEELGADYVVLVMTGNFNERGMPAIMPKENRAGVAIDSGADIVFELPVCYSLSDIPDMALGAIELLNKIGVVDYLVFGSESGDLSDIAEMADILKSDDYLSTYEECYEKTHITWLSRKEALSKLNHEVYSECVNLPNNLLGIAYLNTLQNTDSRIVPLTHKRIGQAYLDDSHSFIEGEKTYLSATAVRKMIEESYKNTTTIPEKLRLCVPECVYKDMTCSLNKVFPVFSSDFNQQIMEAIQCGSVEELSKIAGMNTSVAEIMISESKQAACFEEFDKNVRQRMPNVNLDRRYYRILTRQFSKDIEEYKMHGTVFYANVLATSARAESLMKQIRETSEIPILAGDDQQLNICEAGWKQFNNDRDADELYWRVLRSKFGEIDE